jgi:CRP/FNR family transcriptional regulator
MWRLVVQHTLNRLGSLERKIEHLCHSDVRSRLIFYLDELARLGQAADGNGTSLVHISQNELASLVGATRETTSTTLNTLAREGLISLGHRLVMIPSLDSLRNAGPNASARSTAAGNGQPQM